MSLSPYWFAVLVGLLVLAWGAVSITYPLWALIAAALVAAVVLWRFWSAYRKGRAGMPSVVSQVFGGVPVFARCLWGPLWWHHC